MRKSAFAGLFAVGLAMAIGSPSRAHAQDLLQLESLAVQTTAQPSVLASLASKHNEEAAQAAAAEAPQPAVETYTVTEGDSLNKIAESHHTTWQRLFYKNTDIENPDVIEAGKQLVIPTAEETLAERPLPAAPAAAVAASPAPAPSSSRSAVYSGGMASAAGNRYAPGYCTWYAKNRRPDLPNNLGNADTWVARAAAQGYATGSVPRAGAIGQQGMHVVYVESVNGDGTVTISEMNYIGFGVVSSRTVPAGTFRYIY